MSLVRLFSILVLAVAMLLPPGLFRDCCCSRRAASKEIAKAPVRSCCQAKRASTVREISQNRAQPGSGWQRQQCRCQIQSASSAILASDQRVTASADELVVNLPDSTWSASHVILNLEPIHARSWHYLDPPLRKILCRWVI